MICYRPFLNCDPPGLLQVWREQPPMRGLMQPMSHLLLELYVLSKPYFDRQGLIVAIEDRQIVGFVHAGFGPDSSHTEMSTEIGVICALVVGAHDERADIMRQLLHRAEQYLTARGAREIHVGDVFPLSPFYLGLSGGSDLAGIAAEDLEMEALLRAEGYAELHRNRVYERSLHRYRIPVDRRLVQHRRRYRLIPQVNPMPRHWWDACVFGPSDRIRFALDPKDGVGPHGEILFWDMGPLSTRPHAGGMGILKLEVSEPQRNLGLATFLTSEAMKHLQNSGVHRLEAQVAVDNEPAIRLMQRLGFESIREGVSYGKPV